MKETGAEAVLHFSEQVIKERVKKSYRHALLDEQLRKTRNKKEAKLLEKNPVRSPKLLHADTFSLTMERIQGPRLRDVLNIENAVYFGDQLGKMVRKLHDADIMHADLTTSNVLVENDKDLVIIDFGLGFESKRLEDRAVDLHVLRETLEGTHVQEKEVFWSAFKHAYADEKVLKLLEEVETRGRYKKKY
jgi:Kae1-associated kinase Bud32